MDIIGAIKNYEWGKLGSRSTVAQLSAAHDKNFTIEETTPYAELWMGDHPSGPSKIKATGEELSSKHVKDQLPFLFKVLSIKKALSIQAHPNKQEAEFLHMNRPDVYPDSNHKPELAIALTPFSALCGFRPYEEIINFINVLPPLKSLLSDAADLAALRRGNKADMRACYEKCMTAREDIVNLFVAEIFSRHTDVLQKHGLFEIFKTLVRDFPGDVGILSLFFLNFLQLQEGDAIFLAANEIHAYLDGDCIECMARSDNVIRAGLTPKYKDLGQLLFCLNFAGEPAQRKLFKPCHLTEQVRIFAPPIEDFAVAELKLTSDDFKFPMEAYDAILIVLEGSRILHLKTCCPLPLKRGSIAFISAENAPSIEFRLGKACSGESNLFVAYIASYNFYLKQTEQIK